MIIPTKKDAEEAVLTLIKYITKGNVSNEVLTNTPKRVIKSYSELFSGYTTNMDKEFDKSFENEFNYREMILIDSIDFQSTCEHHMLAIKGQIQIAYIPSESVIGLSKIPRIIEAVTKKMQLQERMTNEIANAVEKYTKASGVAVFVSAKHDCMNIRGVKNHLANTQTFSFLGEFEQNLDKKREFLSIIKK